MIAPVPLKKAYDRLKEIYVDTDKKYMQCDKFRENNNPVKQVFDLAPTPDWECVLRSTNVMCASLPGRNITKTISIDDVTGISKETIVYTDQYLHTVIRENIGLTPLRCAIMAVLAADLNYKINKLTKVGFIGNGNINQKTMEVLNLMFGIESCVIRGSDKDRSKNKNKFIEILGGKGTVTVDYSNDCRLLNECEIVFCCTNSFKKRDMISANILNKPNVIVAQDSGYLLDESFRKTLWRISYTDHPEQLFNHYRSEFPYDKKTRWISIMHENSRSQCKKAIYLYGVAIADLIVFEEFFLEDKSC